MECQRRRDEPYAFAYDAGSEAGRALLNEKAIDGEAVLMGQRAQGIDDSRGLHGPYDISGIVVMSRRPRREEMFVADFEAAVCAYRRTASERGACHPPVTLATSLFHAHREVIAVRGVHALSREHAVDVLCAEICEALSEQPRQVVDDVRNSSLLQIVLRVAQQRCGEIDARQRRRIKARRLWRSGCSSARRHAAP
jgi:hypothetical protein